MILSKQAKSNIIFIAILGSVLFFLFGTNLGTNLRTWMTSFTLSTPDIVSSEVNNIEDQNISFDWMVIDDKLNKVWISEIDKPIFINIWATWCGPCRSEMPSIISLRHKLQGKVEFLLISPMEGMKIIKDFKEKEAIDFPLYINGSEIPENLRSNVYPTTFIIDKNKQIVYKWEGAYDWDTKVIVDKLIELTIE